MVVGPPLDDTPSLLVELKAQILSYGVLPTRAFLDRYGEPYLVKKRAYGNADDLRFLDFDLPQEIVLGPQRIVAAASVRTGSPLLLDVTPQDEFVIRHLGTGAQHRVDFPTTPDFYRATTVSGSPVTAIATLYGGGSIGIFAYGNCALVDMSAACQYCSIAPNRRRQTSFQHAISPRQVEEALDVALADESYSPLQVMLNGGNLHDLDRSFAYYVRLATAARSAIDRSGRDVELHLIAYPPSDLSLLSPLADLDVSLAMNTEVWDLELYRTYCPGKEKLGGRRHLLRGLTSAVEQLGPGSVFSIFVGGLEPMGSLVAGLTAIAELGVVPIVNVFHADPETPLAHHPEPTPDEILTMGQGLQRLYHAYPFCRPFYEGVGRNAIDYEAHLGLFAD